MEQNQISENRRTIYYIGLTLCVLGPVMCFGALAYAFMGVTTARNQFGSGPNPAYIFPPFLLGMGMAAVGNVLRRIGARGLAGSGLKLDPGEAREDLKPWSKMAGGILNDAGINLNSGREKQDFDEKLRKLYQLHRDGILSDREYADQKAAVLEAMKK